MTRSFLVLDASSSAIWVWRIQAWAPASFFVDRRGQLRATSLTMSTPRSRRFKREARSKHSVVLPTPVEPMNAIFTLGASGS